MLQSVASGPAYQRRLNTCKAELQQLVQQKREQCSAERMAKQMMESAEWESRPPPPGKRHRTRSGPRAGRGRAHTSHSCDCFRVASERPAGRPPARTQSCREPHPSLRRALHLRHSFQRRYCQSVGQPEDGGKDHDHQVRPSGVPAPHAEAAPRSHSPSPCLHRSVLTYSRIGGHVKTLTFCQGSHYLAVASDNGSIQLLAIEANKPPKSPKVQPFQSR